MDDKYTPYQYTKQIEAALRETAMWGTLHYSGMNAIEQALKTSDQLVGRMNAMNDLASSLAASQFPILNQLDLSMPKADILEAWTLRWETIANASACIQTPAISKLIDSFNQKQWESGLEGFLVDITSNRFTEVANIAFLRSVDGFTTKIDTRYPKGLKTIIRKMHKSTAERLSNTDDIKVDVESKLFIDADDSVNTANVDEINVISSSTELFCELTETDLMELMRVLSETPELALLCHAGEVIRKIILEWNTCIDFDQEYFYHCRGLKDNSCPYTPDDMGKAPRMYVGPGRFNHVGQSHYYFASTEFGAKQEITKHQRGIRVQTAKIKPIKPVRMIDLSEENAKKYIFLITYDFLLIMLQNLCQGNIIFQRLYPAAVGRQGLRGLNIMEVKNTIITSPGRMVIFM